MGFNFLWYRKRMLLVARVTDAEITAHLLAELQHELQGAGIERTELSADELRFAGPPFRWSGSGFLLFNLVSKAEFRFQRGERLLYLHYRFWFTELLLLAVVFSFPAVVAYWVREPYWIAGILVGAWLGAYAGGIIYTLVRFEKWVEARMQQLILRSIEQKGDPRLTALVKARLKLS